MTTPNDVAKALALLGVDVEKAEPEERYILGIAHQAGPDPAIKMGADGGRDYFTERELEKAARTFMADGGRQIGFMHQDGTVGKADVVESYIYRANDWDMNGTIVKAGDWLIGVVVKDEPTWQLCKAGKITGFSIQGTAKRRARSES